MLPPGERQDWLLEWEGEVAHWWASCPQDLDSRIQLWRFCCGGWFDARYLRLEQPSGWVGRPVFALAAIAALIAVVVAASGGLRTTRRILKGLGYPHPEQIATVSQPGRLIAREGVPTGKIPAWRSEVKGIRGIEGYWWSAIKVDCGGGQVREVLRGQVTPGFFELLGQKSFLLSPETVVLRESTARRCPTVNIDGRRFRVLGTLPDSFWFIDDRIEMWTLLPPERVNSRRLSGVVARMDDGASVAGVQEQIRRVADRTGHWPMGNRAEVAPLAPRVQQPIRFYGWAWLVMFVAAVSWSLWNERTIRGIFFTVKFGLLITVVVFSVLEFTGAAYVGMYGGAVYQGEPGAIWLFVLGSCGALWFSIADQRLRCRECLHRLQMPARIGQPGALLFGIAGTEMVCPHGHGLLYVDEKTENLHESDRWTPLDESWRDLFLQR
jgi:hypothetical protein